MKSLVRRIRPALAIVALAAALMADLPDSGAAAAVHDLASTSTLSAATTSTRGAAAKSVRTAAAPRRTSRIGSALTIKKAPKKATTVYDGSKFCVYSAHSINELNEFAAVLGRSVDCATIFNYSTPNWATWAAPWFLHSPNDPNVNWAGWAKADPNRRLILSQPMVPVSGMPSNWLHLAATGAYDAHAVQLAKTLVNAGLGNTVIRLAHEANNTSYKDAVPDTAAGQADWRKAWANIVTAMRSVPGAAFTFDWTVNYETWGRRNISLNSFYPGDAYVDVVGLDAYDEGLTQTDNRFPALLTKSGGIQAVYNFAAAHGKPMSMPEWGLLPKGGAMNGGGADPSYIAGIGQFIATHHIAYSGYWYAHADTMALLKGSKDSVSALRTYFGANGTAR